jgi:hypothetical protein
VRAPPPPPPVAVDAATTACLGITKLVVAECRRLCADVGFVVPLGVVVVVVVVEDADDAETDEEDDSIESWEAASSSFLLSSSSSTTSKTTGGSCSRRRGGGGGDVRRLDVEEGVVAAPADAARPAAEVAAAKRLRKGEGGAPAPGAPPAEDASRPKLEVDDDNAAIEEDEETTESPRLLTTCNGGKAWPDDRALLPCGPLFISLSSSTRRYKFRFEKSNCANHSRRKNSSKQGRKRLLTCARHER